MQTLSLALASVLVVANGAYALTIDDFESGDFSVTETAVGPLTVDHTQGSLSGVVGGVRESALQLVLNSVGSSATVAVAGGTGSGSVGPASQVAQYQFWYDGVADGINQGITGSLNIDLTAGGADRFVIDVTAFSATSLFLVFVADSSSLAASSIVPGSLGLMEILYSSVPGIDFTDVRAIGLRWGLLNNESISIGSFATSVPEPSTALLVAASLLALLVRRPPPFE